MKHLLRRHIRRPTTVVGRFASACALLLGFVPLATLAGQTPDHEALRRLKEVDWPRAYREQDPVSLDRILADDFRRVGSDGIWSSKADELEYVRTNRPTYDSLVFQIRRLDVYPNGLAIVAGTGVIYSTVGGEPAVSRYESTNVLIKQNGQWRAVASHTSGNRPGRR